MKKCLSELKAIILDNSGVCIIVIIICWIIAVSWLLNSITEQILDLVFVCDQFDAGTMRCSLMQ